MRGGDEIEVSRPSWAAKEKSADATSSAGDGSVLGPTGTHRCRARRNSRDEWNRVAPGRSSCGHDTLDDFRGELRAMAGHRAPGRFEVVGGKRDPRREVFRLRHDERRLPSLRVHRAHRFHREAHVEEPPVEPPARRCAAAASRCCSRCGDLGDRFLRPGPDVMTTSGGGVAARRPSAASLGR